MKIMTLDVIIITLSEQWYKLDCDTYRLKSVGAYQFWIRVVLGKHEKSILLY